jgi:hypothetical protein
LNLCIKYWSDYAYASMVKFLGFPNIFPQV